MTYTAQTDDEAPEQLAAIAARIPFGPHTYLFVRAKHRAGNKRQMDAALAKLTPANIAAMEAVTGWLIEGGFPVPGMALDAERELAA